MNTNLKPARKAAGFTQEEVSNKTGIPLGTIRRWEQDVNEPDISSIITLASLYGVSTDTLLGSKFADEIEGTVLTEAASNYVDIPLYGSIAAGVPIEMIEVDDYFPVPLPMFSRYPDGFLLRVKGESMNRRIPNGSYALIDPRQKEVLDYKPYAICVNGYDATIKRVHPLNNGFELIPDSSDPTFEPQLFNYNEPDTDEIAIIGRVVWITIPFDYEL